MGMALITKPKPRKPWGKGNLVCENCDAEYNPELEWIRVQDRTPKDSTADRDLIKVADCEKDKCPFCSYPNKSK